MRLQDVILRDTRANQPSFADVPPGTLFYVTDESVTERCADDGLSWEDYSDAGAGVGAITSLTGDVTATGPGAAAATIAASAVTNAKLADMADQTIKGNDTGAPAAPQDLSANEVSIVLDGATDPFVRTSAIPSAGITQLTGNVTAGPGSGSQVATVSTPIRTEQIGITVDGGGSLITTGIKGYKSFPVAGTLTGWRLLADAAGDVDFDVTLDPFASYPPTTSILTPSLSGVDSDEATGLSQAVAAGDVFGFEVTGTPLTITRVTLELTIVVTG